MEYGQSGSVRLRTLSGLTARNHPGLLAQSKTVAGNSLTALSAVGGRYGRFHGMQPSCKQTRKSKSRSKITSKIFAQSATILSDTDRETNAAAKLLPNTGFAIPFL
jgi:hypothetical protein